MKILALSDPHGLIKAYKEFKTLVKLYNADIGIISGDLTTYSNNPNEEEQKIKSILDSIGIPVLFIMGNDDQIEWENSNNTKNINQKSFYYKNQNFVGYQYTNPFVGGDFEKSEQEQIVDLKNLESECTPGYILVTHGPAFGILDKISSGKNVGSKALLNFIKRTAPSFHIFGHIHESAGYQSRSINASYPIKKHMYYINTDLMEIKEIKS